MIQIYLLLLNFQFKPTTQYYFLSMNEDYPISDQYFQINSSNYTVTSYFSYGIWSRYTPLGRNNQVGKIGLFDSSCFHLHNVIGQSSRLLNLLLFDCLEYPKKTIKRKYFLKLQMTSGMILKQFQTISNMNFFGIILKQHHGHKSRNFNQFLFNTQKQHQNKLIDVNFPYSDLDLLLTFGGDKYQNIPKIKEGSKFSFFPGKIYQCPLESGENKQKDDQLYVVKDFKPLSKCICTLNMIRDIPDKDLEFLQSQIFTSQNTNCNNFALQSWIKIINIKGDSQEFTYKLRQLSAVFSNSKLINQNLVAFQLYYLFSPKGNKILITTYSYTFLLINIDFSDNPFLIQKEIDILNDIKLWHYISLDVIDNELQFYVTFQEDLMDYHYESFQFVNHFHMVKYQLEYENIQKQGTNYLNCQFRNMNFDNCPEFIDSFSICHFSCERCDGPTSSNCLACLETSNRIYIPEHKSCICPYDTIDNYKCKSYKELGLLLNYDDEPLNKCQFGYFELENECMLCPSIIQENFITCLDCIYNPDSWKKKPFCQINLYSQESQISIQIKGDKQYFISDGNDMAFCLLCEGDENSQYIDYQFHIQEFQYFCLTTEDDELPIKQKKRCYKCDLEFCLVYQITLLNFECVICLEPSTLINGRCELFYPSSNNCVKHYYKDSLQNFKLCDIEFCKYCFEYSSNDSSKSTLYYNYIEFIKDEFHKIGCALCENGFRFDFNKGKCLYNKPSTQNCIRSYISQDNIEVYTLSQIEDFTIAPEISNCLNFIENCKQCIQNPQKEIKCVLCEDGYTASIQTGLCYQCSITNVKNCIEGQAYLEDQWVQLVQSFIIIFILLPQTPMIFLRYLQNVKMDLKLFQQFFVVNIVIQIVYHAQRKTHSFIVINVL